MATKRDSALALHITREIVAKLLVRSLMNAAALLDAAKILRAHGHFGLARSQAISAREEIGKASTSGSFLAGQISAEELASSLRNHNYKQSEGLIIPLLASRMKESPIVTALLTPTVGRSAADIFQELPGKLVAEKENLFTAFEPVFALLRALRDLADTGLHEKARQAGIYVSLEHDSSGVRLEYPQQITSDEADEEIERLTLLVEGFKDAAGNVDPDLWSDDEAAERFAYIVERFIQPGMFDLFESAMGANE